MYLTVTHAIWLWNTLIMVATRGQKPCLNHTQSWSYSLNPVRQSIASLFYGLTVKTRSITLQKFFFFFHFQFFFLFKICFPDSNQKINGDRWTKNNTSCIFLYYHTCWNKKCFHTFSQKVIIFGLLFWTVVQYRCDY